VVETLLSLIPLIAAVILALWPSLGIHDHTIDGLFLTVTGTMLSLIFLFNFIWQLRHQSLQEPAALRRALQRLAHALTALWSKGDTDMRTSPQKISIALVLGTLLLVLAFPGRLNASDRSALRLSPAASSHEHFLSIATRKPVAISVFQHRRRDFRGGELLMDIDIRLRTAANLEGNFEVQKAAENAGVPLRIIVIAASPLLEV
jgi:hypothetical protein